MPALASADRSAGPAPWVVVVAVAVLLALGAAVAGAVQSGLGLTSQPARVPAERAVAVPPAAAVPAPALASVAVPADRRLTLAATAVAGGDGAARPAAARRDRCRGGGSGRRRDAPEGRADRAGPGRVPRGVQPRRRPGGLVVRAATVEGAAAGLYAVADRIRSGADVLPAAERGRVVAPRLRLRLDRRRLGRAASRTPPRSRPGPTTPSTPTSSGGPCCPRRRGSTRRGATDRRAVPAVRRPRAARRGTTASSCPGFLEYVTFAASATGTTSTRPATRTSPGPRRWSRRSGRSSGTRRTMGMRVYLLTDMLAVSPPLERVPGARRSAGWTSRTRGCGRSTRRGWPSCSTRMPFVDGLMVRIGEGGDVYGRPAGTTRRGSRSPRRRRCGRCCARCLRRPRARRTGRSSSAPGPSASARSATCTPTRSRTRRCSGGIDDPHLIVSTKYTLGDFYSHLPLNTRSTSATHRRIVEFQARREFEGFGALPNDLGALHAAGAAAVPRRQPARRGRLELDAGRRPAARRPDVRSTCATGLLAAVRPQRVRRRRGSPGTPTPTRPQVTARLGAADVLRRPGDRRRDRRGAWRCPARR